MTAGIGVPRLSTKERIGLWLHRSLDRWLSPLGVWVMRRTRGGIARPWKVDALLLTTIGRRSGRQRTVVLQFFRGDDDSMIVAAANDGGRSHPGWYLNLTADPAASVEVNGRTMPVRAEVLAGTEAERWWVRILERSPEYERYARATTRRIPILRLVPAAGGRSPS